MTLPAGVTEQRVEIDGLRLNVVQRGAGSPLPPLVLLHGFTGGAAGWTTLAEALAPEFTTIAIEIVGHGRSDAPVAVERYQMRRAVDDLAAVLRALGHERACWLGYSMGGRTALQVAVHRPEVVSSLVLVGASPGLATAAERMERVRADGALADRIERDGVEAFVDEWERVPLFATQQRLPAAVRSQVRAGRLANSAMGLANSLRGMGTGAQEAVHERLAEVRIPVLLSAGMLDAKFAAIAQEMARALPDATIKPIEGSGHAVHLEQPGALAAAVLGFMRRVHAPGG